MKLNISYSSVDSSDTDSFISTVLVLLLALNGHETKSFNSDYKNWFEAGSRFAKSFGFRKKYTQISNLHLAKKGFDEDLADELGHLLKAKMSAFDKDTSISREQLKLLKDISNNLRTASESAWARIHRDIKYINNPKLSLMFTLDSTGVPSKNDIKSAATQLQPLVKAATGRDGCFLNISEAQALRIENPKKYSKYAQLVKIINQRVKHEIFNFVRASSSNTVPIDSLKKHLDNLGIPNMLPTGFVGGLIDADGKCYTAEGRQLDKIPVGPVRMNPLYDPVTDKGGYVIQSIDMAITGRRPEYRTVTMVNSSAKERFSKVGEFIKREDEFVKAWEKDLLHKPVDNKGKRKQILATIVELIHATSSRIGGVGNATAGEPTYGMSTLQVRHLSVTPTMISYDYTGKKAAKQGANYKVNTPVSKRVYTILSSLVKGKAPTDRVFMLNDKPINGAAVNAYLKSLGIELSIHNFRSVAGTKAALKIIAKSPFKKSDHPKQSAVEKWFKDAAIVVGEMLNHRNGEKIVSSTSIASYIDQGIIKDYFESLGLRKPTFLKKVK